MFKSMIIKVVVGKEEKAFVVENNQGLSKSDIIDACVQAKASTLYVPIMGTTDTGEQKEIPISKDTIEELRTNNVVCVKEEGDDSMNNQTTNNQVNNTNTTEVKMTAEEWTKAVIDQATTFVNENGSATVKEVLNTANEENVLTRLQGAVDVTEQSSGKKSGILDMLKAAVSYAKEKALGLWDIIKKYALIAWRKVSAAVVGLGYFSLHTVQIVFNHTVEASKEIIGAFNEDVVQRVKNA